MGLTFNKARSAPRAKWVGGGSGLTEEEKPVSYNNEADFPLHSCLRGCPRQSGRRLMTLVMVMVAEVVVGGRDPVPRLISRQSIKKKAKHEEILRG